MMSQCLIERLERTVAEQKFELEQAKDTIERQHEMYYELMRGTQQLGYYNDNGRPATV